ncbi:MAG: UDP-N-acetylmuramoyl-L-alanine--D-glutamate ligase [Robiginitomaculum sp.]|nr:UDP-N-acetylmuramoyl-L-alanine--D-glutamate ligase [Robiginitomaculum sp.]
MIEAGTFKGKTIAVFGLGRSGITAALSLQKGGADVLAWDDNEASQKSAKDQGVRVKDLTKADWDKIDELMLSPGVPHELPKAHWSAEKAKNAGVPIICDIEIFAREVMARAPERRPNIIAITGTNGKSTTTALIGHILAEAGRDSQVGGNIGRGVLDLEDIYGGANYVLELSSYQLERTYSLKANAAIFLNLTPDHLDRHGDMKAYEQAKLRIFANQTKDDTAIIGVDGPQGKRICSRLKAQNGRRVLPISGKRSLGRGVCVIKGKLYSMMDGRCELVVDLRDAAGLDGEHNWQNAAAAYGAVRALGLKPKTIGKAILSFPGLAHRLENIGHAGPVKYVNDSKATNVDAVAQALKTYDNIYWIAGGQAKQNMAKQNMAKQDMAKEGALDALAPHFGNITRAYLIGEAADDFERSLKAKKVTAKVSTELRLAIMCATKDALASRAPNPVVLLSPACASFDQFKDFEARGDEFRKLSLEIIGVFEREKANIDPSTSPSTSPSATGKENVA